MQTIVLPLGGRSANGVVVAMSNGALFITDLQPGEVALFNENDGVANSIVLRNGKLVEINCATLNINASEAVNITTPAATLTTTTTTITADTATIDAQATNMTGDASIGGAAQVAQTLEAVVDLVAAGKSLKAHVHNGVAAGLANSGPNQ
jgi:phage baseplate assembly protein V